MAKSTLFAWVRPAFIQGAPADHTWVTGFDARSNTYNDIKDVVSAGQACWLSWGDYHPSGGTPDHRDGLLATGDGDLAVACCVAAPNLSCSDTKAARGTIFRYGIDGVCHQLSNQILYATRAPGRSPLTVEGAAWYRASHYFWDTYGRDPLAWKEKIAACDPQPLTPMGAAPAHPGMIPMEAQSFEQHALSALRGDQALVDRLLALRNQRGAELHASSLSATPPSAEQINADNQRVLDEAAKLLGRDQFVAVFGFEPGTRVNLVDPEIFEREAGSQSPPPMMR